MKVKPNDWLDTGTREVFYGIDAFVDGAWHHLASDGKPLFFKSAVERNMKIKELRNQ
jgi:hypothetical protein